MCIVNCSGLVVCHGKPEAVIPELVQKLGTEAVQALVFHEEVTNNFYLKNISQFSVNKLTKFLCFVM